MYLEDSQQNKMSVQKPPSSTNQNNSVKYS